MVKIETLWPNSQSTSLLADNTEQLGMYLFNWVSTIIKRETCRNANFGSVTFCIRHKSEKRWFLVRKEKVCLLERTNFSSGQCNLIVCWYLRGRKYLVYIFGSWEKLHLLVIKVRRNWSYWETFLSKIGSSNQSPSNALSLNKQ